MNERERLIDLIVSAEDQAEDQREAVFLYGTVDELIHMPSRAENVADYLLDHGVSVQRWIPASKPPKEYRDKYGDLIPFLVCEGGTEYPFRAMYDGKTWGDGLFAILVKWWMPLPEPPKGE